MGHGEAVSVGVSGTGMVGVWVGGLGGIGLDEERAEAGGGAGPFGGLTWNEGQFGVGAEGRRVEGSRWIRVRREKSGRRRVGRSGDRIRASQAVGIWEGLWGLLG